MTESNECQCCGKHDGHLCVLTSLGQTDAVAELTNAPTVVCFTCGREANCADNVCMPMPLEK